nr:reverse transcriptase domain-containing protein [Tanacetum cinerariifolium]
MGYEHFNTNLVTKNVAESNTKNLIPIPNKCMVVSKNGSQSNEHINDNSSIFTTILNPLSDVESNSDESTSNHDTVKSDYLMNSMDLSFLSTFLRKKEPEGNMQTTSTEWRCCSQSTHEEIDVVSITNDVLPPSDDDSDEEVDTIGDLRVYNFIQNSEHEYSESEDSDFDNPLLSLPPPESPDKEFDFEKEISVVRNVIVKFECIDARVKFDVFNDENNVLSYRIFVIFAKEFSLCSAESEDIIFDPGFFPVDEVFLCWIFVRFPRSSYPLIDSSLGKGSLPVARKRTPRVLFSLGRILFPNSSMNCFPPQEQQIFVMKSPIFNNGLMNRFMSYSQTVSSNPTSSFRKAVEEICVTCSGAHPYYQCLAAGGNTFPELRDNIQGYVLAATVNYNQGNSIYRPPRSGSLPSNTVANPKGKLKSITTRSGIVLDGPSVPNPSPFINQEEDECVEETLMDQDLSEYTIKVPPPPVQKYKPPSQRDFVVHQRDPLHPNIPYPSRMLKQKEKDEVQIHKFWQMFKQLNINITLAYALILIPKYHKMLKALLSNKEKLQELENTHLNENYSAVILKKLPKKLRDPGKFLIPCGFSELKCKALADLGASINLMSLSVWKKLGLPELISTRMTLELAKREICTSAKIARDVFVPVGKFTFSADFVIVDYESDPRVPLILGRPFLQTARALIDVHSEKMILRDGDERLTLNMRHDTSSYSNQPQKESINLINVFNESSEDFLEDLFSINQPSGNPTFSSHPELTLPEVKDDFFDPEGGNFLPEKLLYLDSTKDLYPSLHVNPLSDSTTYSSSPNQLFEELADELALIKFPPKYDDDLYNLANLADNFVDSMPEMSTDEHALDYSSHPLYDEYDDLFKVEVDALPSTNNEDKVFNPGILIQENPFEIITRVVQDKKLAISNAFLMIEDFDPPLYELPFFKEVPRYKILLLFSSKNKEKVFKPGIHTRGKVHSSLISELSHQGYKVFKINQILKIPMKNFLFSCRKDTNILAVPCLHFYPLDQFKYGGAGSS